MATHSSILGLKIPWTEESGGLQSRASAKSGTGLKRLSTHTHGNAESMKSKDLPQKKKLILFHRGQDSEAR